MNSKVVRVEPKTYQDKVTGHIITLENGTSGYLDDKGSDKDIKEGEIVEYEGVQKQNKKGGTYTLLTLKRLVTTANNTTGTVTAPPAPQPVSFVPPVQHGNLDALKVETLVPIARIIMDGIIAGKIESNTKDFREWYNVLTDDIFSSIDELKG
jgi:hypothetical protein